MVSKDPYRLLGLDPDASEEQVRAAFRQKVMQQHPDTASGGGGPEVQEIIEAYRALIDPDSRSKHSSGRSTTAGAAGHSVRVRHTGRGQRVPTDRGECGVCEGSGILQQRIACPDCGGRAEITALDGDRARIVACRRCLGAGTVGSRRTCDACEGSGLAPP